MNQVWETEIWEVIPLDFNPSLSWKLPESGGAENAEGGPAGRKGTLTRA